MMIIWVELLDKFIRFGVVGFSGMVVDFGVTWVAKERVRCNKYVANSLGFIAAASTNYVLNRMWTFQSTNSAVGQEYLMFICVSLVGLVINTGVIYLLNGRCKMNFYLSKVAAIGLTTLWNFGANYLITFAK